MFLNIKYLEYNKSNDSNKKDPFWIVYEILYSRLNVNVMPNIKSTLSVNPFYTKLTKNPSVIKSLISGYFIKITSLGVLSKLAQLLILHIFWKFQVCNFRTCSLILLKQPLAFIIKLLIISRKVSC